MRIAIPALILSVLVIPFRLVLGDHDRAEDHIRSFYSQMISANFSGAQKSVQEAIRLWPSYSRNYAWRAYCNSQTLPSQCSRCAGTTALGPAVRQTIQRSIDDYRGSLALNSRDAIVHHNLGWLSHLIGDESTASAEWEQAIALDPNNAEYHLSFGMFLEEQGDTKGMTDQYMRGVQASPGILDSPFFRDLRTRSPNVASMIVSQTIERTEADLRKTDDAILKARLGKLYLYTKNAERASALLQQASEDLPNLPLVWFNLGEVRCMQGQCDEAVEYYWRAHALDKSLAGPLLRTGEAFQRQRQPKSALEYFRSAARSWERMRPVTAGRNQRLYRGFPQTIDDLLPTTLVWYTSPCEASIAFRHLAELSPRDHRYLERVNTCEQIPNPHSC
jgi:Tfp pilus assembly protein PilF